VRIHANLSIDIVGKFILRVGNANPTLARKMVRFQGGREAENDEFLSELETFLHFFETLPSTNQTLWNLIDQGAEPGTVVIATQQTSGRGQWGRQWSSPPGGLYLSVAIAPNLPVQQSYHLTLCSAWGIAMALREHGIPVGLKWPNDLMLCGRKLGGILTETKVQQGRITKAVVGVGINWANPVPETGINLQSFQANQPAPIASLEMLAAVTLLGIASGYEHSQTGIDALLPSYQELLTSRGRLVFVNGHAGIIVGVTSTGELQVRLCAEKATNSVADREICLKPGTISLGYD
jgi:BirA family biotin operon repressor/biotin-[acetyl-CoA-carboxylase] ligase